MLSFEEKQKVISLIKEKSQFSREDYQDAWLMDKEIGLALLEQDTRLIEYLHPSLQNDADIIQKCTNDYTFFRHVPYSIKNNNSLMKKLIISSLQNSAFGLETLEEKWWNDDEIVKLAMETGGYALEKAPEHIRNDEAWVKLALYHTSRDIFSYIGKELLSQHHPALNIIRAATEKNENLNVYQHLDKSLQNNFIFIKEMLKISPSQFKYIKREFQEKKELLAMVIERYPDAIKLASEHSRNNITFARIATQQNGSLVQYLGSNPKKDLIVAMNVAKTSPEHIILLDKHIRNNRGVALAAVRQNGMALKYIKDDLRADEEIVFVAVKQNGFAISYVQKEMINNYDLNMLAVKNVKTEKTKNSLILGLIASQYRDDLDFVYEACKSHPENIKYAGKTIKKTIGSYQSYNEVMPRLQILWEKEQLKKTHDKTVGVSENMGCHLAKKRI